jgi:hypothetical protein
VVKAAPKPMVASSRRIAITPSWPSMQTREVRGTWPPGRLPVAGQQRKAPLHPSDI